MIRLVAGGALTWWGVLSLGLICLALMALGACFLAILFSVVVHRRGGAVGSNLLSLRLGGGSPHASPVHRGRRRAKWS